MIVPGAARPAMPADSARPSGISPNEPKKSRLTTRESMFSGTSSISIVSQTATAKPMQVPRTTASTPASSYHGDSTSPAMQRLFTSQMAYERIPRRRRGCRWPYSRVPVTVPRPISDVSTP